jgi:hypothetical protein
MTLAERATEPTLIRARFVEVLREIPALVSLLRGDPRNIVEYVDEEQGDLARALDGLKSPKVLVYISEVSPEGFNGILMTRISLGVRGQNPFPILHAIVTGISEASGTNGLPMLTLIILPRLSPMKFLGASRQMIYVQEFRAFDYFEIRVGFSDKGY